MKRIVMCSLVIFLLHDKFLSPIFFLHFNIIMESAVFVLFELVFILFSSLFFCVSRTSCQVTCWGSLRTVTAGRNSGWSSLTSASFSTSRTRMTTLWPAFLCWATLSLSHPSRRTSTRTTSSNSTSSPTSTTLDRRASTRLKGGWRWSAAPLAPPAAPCRAPGKTFTNESAALSSPRRRSPGWRSGLSTAQTPEKDSYNSVAHKQALINTSE